jgi:outer membrane murein-binding lipoprotein Lpp
MAVNQTSTVVGVFRDRTQADQAMDALNNAGFDRSQIHFAGPGTKGNFLEDIKSLFVGQSTSGNDLTNNFTDMGLSNEEAQYYNNEYSNGNTVVTVQAPDREQEALNVLHSYNAYTYQDNSASAGPANYAQQPAYAEQSDYNTTYQEAPVQDTQPQYQADGQPSYADVPLHDQPTVVTNTNYQQPYSTTDPDRPIEPQPDVATDERDNANYQQPYSTTNPDRPAAEWQSDVATNERDTEFQNLQAQIQALQQQLQDARAQLQSAKEREAQFRAAREERERRLNEHKQQLQDLQAELQNTLAELRDTQSRIGQYQ